MRKRLLLLLGCVLAVLAAGWLALWLTAPKQRVNLASFEQIRPGMGEGEVERILGPPAETGEPPPGQERFAAVGGEGQGVRKVRILVTKRWTGEGGTILVSFGEGRTVVDREFYDPEGGKGFLTRLRRWLGIAP
jgi:hypothetical protein